MSTFNTQSHNLSFIPAAPLEENISLALAGMGQRLGHQKLQELAARVQGYTSLNHRAGASPSDKTIALAIDGLVCESGADFASLDVDWLLTKLTATDIDKARRTLAAMLHIDPLGEGSITLAAPVFGYKYTDEMDADVADGLSFDELEERYAGERIGLSSVRMNICIRTGEVWLSGSEKYGLPFSSKAVHIDELEQGLITGELNKNNWLKIQ